MSLVFIDGQYSHIRCDGDKCEVRSPSIEEMTKNHGLANMGWFVSGGVHRCPVHYADASEPRSPLYLITKGDKLVPDPKRLRP